MKRHVRIRMNDYDTNTSVPVTCDVCGEVFRLSKYSKIVMLLAANKLVCPRCDKSKEKPA